MINDIFLYMCIHAEDEKLFQLFYYYIKECFSFFSSFFALLILFEKVHLKHKINI